MLMTPEYLRSRLDYDPLAGVFLWREKLVRNGKLRRHDLAWNTRYAGKVAGTPITVGYIDIRLTGPDGIKRSYLAHRLAWFYMTEEWPREEIDHINRNGRDNRLSNLREASSFQNNGNTAPPKNNTSGIKGVYWNKRDKRWRAQIGMGNTVKALGDFLTKEDAAQARKAAERAYFGEFAECRL